MTALYQIGAIGGAGAPSQPQTGGGGGGTGGGGGANAGAPDPFAGNGSAPPVPFPNSFQAQALPTNVPAWWSNGIMPAGNSSVLITNFVNQYTAQYNRPYMSEVSSRYVVNTTGNTAPTTTWTANPNGRWDSSPQGTVTVPYFGTGAASMLTGDNTDNQMVIWDWNSKVTYSMWGTTVASGKGTNPSWPPSSNTMQIVNSTDTSYPGFGPGTLSGISSSTSACGEAYVSQMVTYADWLYYKSTGNVTHMLFCAVGNPEGSPVNPASSSDGVSAQTLANGGIPEGTIFYFPSNISMSPATFASLGCTDPNFAMMIFTFLQKYGMIVGDSTANGGIGIAVEDWDAWNLYNPTLFPSEDGTHWMWTNQSPYWGGGPLLGMPWSELIAIEPGTLLCPLQTDNNATTTKAMKATQAFNNLTSSTGSIALASATSANDQIILSGTVGPLASSTTGTVISGLGATWTKVYETAYQYSTSGQYYTDFLYVGYACGSGNTTITTTLVGNTAISVSRWSGSSASSPIVGTPQTFSDFTGGVKNSFSTGSVTTTAAGQVVLGVCHVGFADITENAFGAVSELNYGGTTWSTGNFNRHIMNANMPVSNFQNCIVPSGTGTANISGTFHINGYNGYGGYLTCLMVLNP